MDGIMPQLVRSLSHVLSVWRRAGRLAAFFSPESFGISKVSFTLGKMHETFRVIAYAVTRVLRNSSSPAPLLELFARRGLWGRLLTGSLDRVCQTQGNMSGSPIICRRGH